MTKLLTLIAVALPLSAGVAFAAIPAKKPEAARPMTHSAVVSHTRKTCTAANPGMKAGHCTIRHVRHVPSQKVHSAHSGTSKTSARS